MENTLILGLEEFQKLPQKDKFTCLFENQCKTLNKLDNLERLIKGYKLHQNIQYGAISIMTLLGLYLIQIHLK